MTPPIRLDPGVLGQLLVMQSIVGNLPDEKTMFEFLCRGLGELPGIRSVVRRPDCSDEPARVVKAVRMENQDFGCLGFEVRDPDAFSPYEPYVENFCFQVAVILEERRRRRENQDQKVRLELQAAELEKSLQDLEKSLNENIEAETMAALGKMTSSMAHEINSPLGAIQSSAGFLRQGLGEGAPSFWEFLRSLSEEDYRIFAEIDAAVPPRPGPAGLPGRRRTRELTSRLGPVLGDEAPVVADAVQGLTLPGCEEPLLTLAGQGKTALVLWAARVQEWRRSDEIILEAAGQVNAIVSKLQLFSRSSPAGGDEEIDPTAVLDALLLLFFAKHEIVVEKCYEPGLRFTGNRNQFDPILVTLMTRVLKGRNSRGRLILKTRRVGGSLEITLADDTLAPFEDFRLDFCRSLAEGLGGNFGFRQDEGWSHFTLRIPVPGTPVPDPDARPQRSPGAQG